MDGHLTTRQAPQDWSTCKKQRHRHGNGRLLAAQSLRHLVESEDTKAEAWRVDPAGAPYRAIHCLCLRELGHGFEQAGGVGHGCCNLWMGGAPLPHLHSREETTLLS